MIAVEPEFLPEGRFVLVVDDEPRVRDVVARLIASADHPVLGVADGASALAIACAHPERVSCIVLDVHMPEMTGFEVLERLRRQGLDIPVVLSSGGSRTEHLGDATRVFFIRKPYLRADLLQVLERAMAAGCR